MSSSSMNCLNCTFHFLSHWLPPRKTSPIPTLPSGLLSFFSFIFKTVWHPSRHKRKYSLNVSNIFIFWHGAWPRLVKVSKWDGCRHWGQVRAGGHISVYDAIINVLFINPFWQPTINNYNWYTRETLMTDTSQMRIKTKCIDWTPIGY